MKFGVREICDVVLRAKKKMTVGKMTFHEDMPVFYFDSLKTSTMEGAATTVYAQGGRGNSRLVAWEGERTVTFTMEDALISPEGFMILSGAGLIEGSEGKSIKVHVTEQVQVASVSTTEGVVINLHKDPYFGTGSTNKTNDLVYIMLLDDHGNPTTEPYCMGISKLASKTDPEDATKTVYPVQIPTTNNNISEFDAESVVLVDYYTEKITSGTKQIEISADKFGGNYYLEASTLFRTTDGVDMPAEFIIPNCKIQSNFTFTMASSGDPSTFTFTMDAFPDYTRFDKTKKVLAAIQIIEEDDNTLDYRTATPQPATVVVDEEEDDDNPVVTPPEGGENGGGEGSGEAQE
jgi:hypothetical protein